MQLNLPEQSHKYDGLNHPGPSDFPSFLPLGKLFTSLNFFI